MEVYVEGVGLWAPGLPGWRRGQAVLGGCASYRDDGMPAFDRPRLSPNVARRASFIVRLALQVADEAVEGAGQSPERICSVFACSGGDAHALETIFAALALPDRPVSPAQFINSVHNAPGGYWSIATGSREPSVSLSAYDASFAAGLLEAASLSLVEDQAALLIAYDAPPPPFLFSLRPVGSPFAVALLLRAAPSGGSLFHLQAEPVVEGEETRLSDPDLERLRAGNPAARSLPLLRAMAMGARGNVVLPYLDDGRLRIMHEPC